MPQQPCGGTVTVGAACSPAIARLSCVLARGEVLRARLLPRHFYAL